MSAWLRDHPGVEVVSRDRSPASSQVATEAAPKAQQVAARWRLLKNVSEAVERLFDRQYPRIADELKPADRVPEGRGNTSPEADQAHPTTPKSDPQQSPRTLLRSHCVMRPRWRRGRRVGRFERVHEPHRQGEPIRAIARELGMSRNGVRRSLRGRNCPDRRADHRKRRSRLDAHREWFDARVAEGRIKATELHGELGSRGVVCSYAVVRRYLNERLGWAGKRRPKINATRPRAVPLPPAKRLSFDWIRGRRGGHDGWERWPGGGSREPAENDKAPVVWTCRIHAAKASGIGSRLNLGHAPACQSRRFVTKNAEEPLLDTHFQSQIP